MNLKNVNVVAINNVATVAINRPLKLNALNRLTIAELHQAFNALELDGEISVIILTGTGEKAFVSGGDIEEFSHFSVQEGTQLAAQGQEVLFNFIENLKKPVIAAINGFALGGGMELAMACHFRIACNSAKLGMPETSFGIIPGYGGTQRLPQLIGKGRAMEMIMTAEMISADEAFRIGLVNHVVPQSELLEFCNQIAKRIQKNSPIAIGRAIEAVNACFSYGVNGFDAEIKHFGQCFANADFKERTSAFLSKRQTTFKGR
jgi:enoyl-CoA hydratase